MQPREELGDNSPPFLSVVTLFTWLPDAKPSLWAINLIPQPHILATAHPQAINRAMRAINPPHCCIPAPFLFTAVRAHAQSAYSLSPSSKPLLLSCARLTQSHPHQFVSYQIACARTTLSCLAHSEPIPIPYRFPHHTTTPMLWSWAPYPSFFPHFFDHFSFLYAFPFVPSALPYFSEHSPWFPLYISPMTPLLLYFKLYHFLLPFLDCQHLPAHYLLFRTSPFTLQSRTIDFLANQRMPAPL